MLLGNRHGLVLLSHLFTVFVKFYFLAVHIVPPVLVLILDPAALCLDQVSLDRESLLLSLVLELAVGCYLLLNVLTLF